MATARFALACPTTNLSSSATIWRGVSALAADAVRSGRAMAMTLQLLDGDVGVRVDAQLSGNLHRPLGNLPGLKRGVAGERARGRHRKRAARTDSHDAVVGLDEI